ncbi:MAG: response regulator [Halarcobacter sp.]
MASIDRELLKRLRILYVEDDENIKNELSSLFSNFFKTVYTASNGLEGLELYKEKKDRIDVIIADINMPKLSGIEMISQIRKSNKDIPVIFATAYSDSKLLVEAIKLKVSEYIIKPIDIKKLMTILAEIALRDYNKFMLEQQNKELEKYKDIIYNNNIVIKIDKNMNITYTNDLFCEITGFDKDELIGKELNSLKHPDLDKKIYEKIYDSISKNNFFNDRIKNITKDGGYYISDTTVISTLDDNGQITGALMIQKDETKEVVKRREVQTSLIKDKGEIFIKSKANVAEQQQTINRLKDDIEILKNEVQKAKADKDRYIYTAEKFTVENKRLKMQLKKYIKDSEYVDDKRTHTMRLTKENSDLKIEIKQLNTKLNNLIDEHEKECKQIKVNYEVKIDDLEEELNGLKTKFDSIENAEAISQKLAYWKEKAKSEAKKLEKMEKEIINHGDKTIMTKLFGNR